MSDTVSPAHPAQQLHEPTLLRFNVGLNDFTTALMGWVDEIPNVVLAMTFLKDKWEKFNESYQSFCDRTQSLVLEPLQGTQAVDLIGKRMDTWPGARPHQA